MANDDPFDSSDSSVMEDMDAPVALEPEQDDNGAAIIAALTTDDPDPFDAGDASVMESGDQAESAAAPPSRKQAPPAAASKAVPEEPAPPPKTEPEDDDDIFSSAGSSVSGEESVAEEDAEDDDPFSSAGASQLDAEETESDAVKPPIAPPPPPVPVKKPPPQAPAKKPAQAAPMTSDEIARRYAELHAKPARSSEETAEMRSAYRELMHRGDLYLLPAEEASVAPAPVMPPPPLAPRAEDAAPAPMSQPSLVDMSLTMLPNSDEDRAGHVVQAASAPIVDMDLDDLGAVEQPIALIDDQGKLAAILIQKWSSGEEELTLSITQTYGDAFLWKLRNQVTGRESVTRNEAEREKLRSIHQLLLIELCARGEVGQVLQDKMAGVHLEFIYKTLEHLIPFTSDLNRQSAFKKAFDRIKEERERASAVHGELARHAREGSSNGREREPSPVVTVEPQAPEEPQPTQVAATVTSVWQENAVMVAMAAAAVLLFWWGLAPTAPTSNAQPSPSPTAETATVGQPPQSSGVEQCVIRDVRQLEAAGAKIDCRRGRQEQIPGSTKWMLCGCSIR